VFSGSIFHLHSFSLHCSFCPDHSLKFSYPFPHSKTLFVLFFKLDSVCSQLKYCFGLHFHHLWLYTFCVSHWVLACCNLSVCQNHQIFYLFIFFLASTVLFEPCPRPFGWLCLRQGLTLCLAGLDHDPPICASPCSCGCQTHHGF
jgi:hypothetical protein